MLFSLKDKYFIPLLSIRKNKFPPKNYITIEIFHNESSPYYRKKR
jgi:hypothetical protein